MGKISQNYEMIQHLEIKSQKYREYMVKVMRKKVEFLSLSQNDQKKFSFKIKSKNYNMSKNSEI